MKAQFSYVNTCTNVNPNVDVLFADSYFTIVLYQMSSSRNKRRKVAIAVSNFLNIKNGLFYHKFYVFTKSFSFINYNIYISHCLCCLYYLLHYIFCLVMI